MAVAARPRWSQSRGTRILRPWPAREGEPEVPCGTSIAGLRPHALGLRKAIQSPTCLIFTIKIWSCYFATFSTTTSTLVQCPCAVYAPIWAKLYASFWAKGNSHAVSTHLSPATLYSSPLSLFSSRTIRRPRSTSRTRTSRPYCPLDAILAGLDNNVPCYDRPQDPT